MTPDHMAELAARLRFVKHTADWIACDEAADLIESMAQRTNEQDILDVLDWENLRNGAIRALNPANQWAFDRLAQRVPLTVDRIEELANKHNANLWRYHAYEQDAIIRLIRAVECEHGIVDRQVEQAHGIRSEK